MNRVVFIIFLMSLNIYSQEENLQLFSQTKLVLADVFKGKFGEKVKGKGNWVIEAGVLTGTPTEGQKHAPVSYIKQACKDGIIQYEFRMDNAKVCQLVLDDDTRDHKLRLVTVENGKIIVIAGSAKGKTLKNAGKTKNVEPFNKSEWHRVTLEYLGSKMAVHVNGNLVFNKSVNKDFAADKSIIAFTMKGKASFRNFKYWIGQAKE